MRPIFTFFVFVFCLFPPAYAEKADRNKPTHIEANQMVADDVKQVTIFTGNVIITRGTMQAKADRVVLVQDPEGYQYSTLYAAPGQLASMREKRDGGPDLWVEGYGERIEYNNRTEVVRLFTRANLKRLEGKTVTDDIKGEYISYDSKSEFYQVHNTPEGKSVPGEGRVRAIIQPRERKSP
jgi:lipopolysaccharide export system protein LptA